MLEDTNNEYFIPRLYFYNRLASFTRNENVMFRIMISLETKLFYSYIYWWKQCLQNLLIFHPGYKLI